jgi:hypothetical protein
MIVIIRSDNSELFCVPTTHAGFTVPGANIVKPNMASRGIEPEAPAKEELLYLVGKYEKTQLSKRDMQYLLRVKDVMMKCLGVVNLREQRALMRSTVMNDFGHVRDTTGGDVVKRGTYYHMKLMLPQNSHKLVIMRFGIGQAILFYRYIRILLKEPCTFYSS